MRRRLLALCTALVLLCACGREERRGRDTPAQGQYSVYFLSSELTGEGSALPRQEFRSLPPGTAAVEGLMSLLLTGPEGEELASPFPQGTTLRSWRQEEGVAYIDLSEAYGGLSGVDQTLADACIVLTLCQLDNVKQVSITVDGHPRPFRDQVLEPADFLLEIGTDEKTA